VDIDKLPFSPSSGGDLVFLGRISPEKGLAEAIRIARRAERRLKIAARMPLADSSDPNVRTDWEYYQGVVEPRLREPGIEFLGELGDAEKADLLGDAAALLFPIDWPEPFGLVMAEATACGTPVVARRRGSVPEVVTHGVTGFIGETDDELVALCQQVDRISRAACRAETMRRFSPAAMTDGYEQVYATVLRAALPGEWSDRSPRDRMAGFMA
jgi:glycosyltransferase involved in cell wall biosynthesis